MELAIDRAQPPDPVESGWNLTAQCRDHHAGEAVLEQIYYRIVLYNISWIRQSNVMQLDTVAQRATL